MYRSLLPVGGKMFLCREHGEYFGDYFIASLDSSFRYRIEGMSTFEYLNETLYVANDYQYDDICIYDAYTDELLHRIHGQFLLSSDGEVQSVEPYDIFTGKYGVIQEEDHYKIVDHTSVPFQTILLDKYPASMMSVTSIVGDYILVSIYGADKKHYFTLFDTEGNELYAPIARNTINASTYDDIVLYADGNVFVREYRIDKTGNITKLDWFTSGCDVSDAERSYIIKFYESGFCEYRKLDGTPLFQLKIKK